MTNSGRSPQLGSESLHPSAARHRVRLHGGELFVLRTKSFMLRVRRNSSVTPEGVKALARGPPLVRQQPTSVFQLDIILINKQTKKTPTLSEIPADFVCVTLMWNSTERMVVKHGVHGPILAHQDSNLANLLNFKSQKMSS